MELNNRQREIIAAGVGRETYCNLASYAGCSREDVADYAQTVISERRNAELARLAAEIVEAQRKRTAFIEAAALDMVRFNYPAVRHLHKQMFEAAIGERCAVPFSDRELELWLVSHLKELVRPLENASVIWLCANREAKKLEAVSD